MDANDQPILFPNTEENLYGYTVNFSLEGRGEAPHGQVQIDWSALITVFAAICTQGGDRIKHVLIAEDLIPTLRRPGDAAWG